MIEESILKNEEKAIYFLRSLYKQYGYLPFKMSKFEEYELYVRNKEFLVNDKIITFTDMSGKLMALKPDVTLSIIKNGEDRKGYKQKVYYNENCYRVSESTHQYKEIMQSGIECIGDIDIYDVYEVILLAAKSLELISKEFLLEISHLGILSSLLDNITKDKEVRLPIIDNISKKNTHDLKRICIDNGISDGQIESLCKLITIYGKRDEVLKQLEELPEKHVIQSAIDELKEVSSLLDDLEFSDKIIYDFSIVSDMNYYNSIVIKGFLNGIYEAVLSGGEYDNLMNKIGRNAKAVGFALYLDLLEELNVVHKKYDVDVVLLYDVYQASNVKEKVEEIITSGRSVSAQKIVPDMFRYKELIDLRKGVKTC